MNKKIFIVIPCGFLKKKTTTAAEDLYLSGYFRNNLCWAKSVTQYENIFILSAKYGLIHLSDIISPYEIKMGQSGSINPVLIKKQAEDFGFQDALIYSVAGRSYLLALGNAGIEFMAPTLGLTIGRHQSMLKRNIGKLPLYKKTEVR